MSSGHAVYDITLITGYCAGLIPGGGFFGRCMASTPNRSEVTLQIKTQTVDFNFINDTSSPFSTKRDAIWTRSFHGQNTLKLFALNYRLIFY